MSEPFLGELRPFAFNFPPRGWAYCNGQLLSIAQNTALFSLLGTMYGGDGRVNFALPNLQGRTPVHAGSIIIQGEQGGEENHTLIISEMPNHVHTVRASGSPANTGTPSNAALLATAQADIYASPDALTPMHPGSVSNAGGNQPHNNMQPYLVLNFCIAIQGIFPSRN